MISPRIPSLILLATVFVCGSRTAVAFGNNPTTRARPRRQFPTITITTTTTTHGAIHARRTSGSSSKRSGSSSSSLSSNPHHHHQHRDDDDNNHDDSPASSSSTISEEITVLMSKHDPILLFASRLLPPDAARDASALYAWCRRLDEIADDVNANNNNNDEDANMVSLVRRRLDEWEARFDELVDGRPADGMDAELARYLLRRRRQQQRDEDGTTGASSMVEVERPFRDMIAGMKSDAIDGPRTVESMEELEVYAYQVAGTVGLMLLPLLNADEEEEARAPAVALGKAIQLINILRDAAPDAALGRVYLPRDVLASEGVSIDEVLNLRSSEGYRRAVERVADRAGELLAEAEVGRSTLPGSGPLFVQVIVELYRTYLVELERRGYDNLNAEGERVKIGTLRKAAASCRAIYATYSPF